MDTDDLSVETYRATLVEAERFDHTITLHFGLLSYDCNNEQEFIEAVEQVLRGYKEAEAWELEDLFYGELPDMDGLRQTADKIRDNLQKVKQIPLEERHFEF